MDNEDIKVKIETRAGNVLIAEFDGWKKYKWGNDISLSMHTPSYSKGKKTKKASEFNYDKNFISLNRIISMLEKQGFTTNGFYKDSQWYFTIQNSRICITMGSDKRVLSAFKSVVCALKFIKKDEEV